ncbi:hypothetical protein O181_014847 [Austropuccinia psidii MF-1]|uniref:Uncharacterized protein n=1 Tax=Austropuccinia psidii MF-1 TaxID=1389203 RepID=A0A9Q3C0Z9_9BASI|nr:hypothetical protein [Austropuccinia psidii MF-1]
MHDNRFSKKYWKQETQKYNLSHEIHCDDSNELESDSEYNYSSSSSGIVRLSNEESDSDGGKESSELDENEIMEKIPKWKLLKRFQLKS